MIKRWGDGSWWSGTTDRHPTRRTLRARRNRRFFVRVDRLIVFREPRLAGPVGAERPTGAWPVVIETFPSVRFEFRRSGG